MSIRAGAVRRRPGFTLIEMMISITVSLLCLAIVVPFFRVQVLAVGTHSGRMDAQQNVTFGASVIDRELRVAGVGVVSTQPLIIQAGPYAITFSVDFASRSPSDLGSVYYDPDVLPAAVTSLTPARAIALPLSAMVYPDTTYTQAGGAPSTAETISFWVEPDTSAMGAGLHALYRRVNDVPPTLVARGIVVAPGEPVFRYFQPDTLGSVREISQALLPIYHTAKIHGSASDTLRSALTDSIRIVRVRLTGRHTDRDGKVAMRTVDTGIRIMNSGLLQFSTCGEPPRFAGPASATLVDPPPAPRIEVTWPASTDEATGEQDVERYVIYRRESTALEWSEPYASVPAGNPSYAFSDSGVKPGEAWTYAVAAQDCSAQLSPLRQSGSVMIP